MHTVGSFCTTEFPTHLFITSIIITPKLMRDGEFKRSHFEEYDKCECPFQFLFHEKTTYIHTDTYLLLPLLCYDSISMQVTIQNTSIRQKENSPRTITTDYLLNGSLRKRLNRTASRHYGVALCVMAPRLYCVRPSATCHNARPLFLLATKIANVPVKVL